MKKFNYKKIAIDIAVEIVGCFIISIALYNFALKSEFPMTGFSGISMIIYRLFGFQIGLTTLLLNVPIALICYKLLGKGFLFRSIRCLIISSIMIDYIAPLLPVYEGERFLSAVVTGVLSGLGYAMIYMRNSSTGGADFITMSIKSLHPHISIGKIIFAFDSIIVLIGGIIFKDVDGIIYGIIISYIVALVADKLMYGVNAGKLALIITDFPVDITKIIDKTIERGSTIINALGGYKQDDKAIVLVACSKKEMYGLEQAIKKFDSKSFIVIMESNEVLGNGFKSTRIAQKNKE